MSVNTNGLLGSTDVWRNGDYNSALYLRKGEEDILTSPTTIISQGLSSTLTLEVADSGAVGIVGPSKDIMTVSANGATIVMGDATTTETFLKVTGVSGESQVYDPVYNPPPAPVQRAIATPASNPGQRGTQTTRPLLFDTSGNTVVYPTFPLMRFFNIATPSTVGSRTTIVDASGNTFSSADWTCMVAGFRNDSGDRTYNCWCEINSGTQLWQVAYDQAGGGGDVNVLCISNSMFLAGSVGLPP